MRTSLLIPCYNEAEGIPQLCGRLGPLVRDLQGGGDVEVVFVDDGSTDATAEQIARHAEGLPYRVLTHEHNRGLGAALRTGLSACAGEEIVVLDSDCTYDPAQTPALLRALREGCDLVTSSPYHPRGRVVGVAAWRLWMSKGLSRVYWLLLPQRLHTYTSCFRAYRRDALPPLAALPDGFLAVTQLLVESILLGRKVAEVPATLTTRRFGQSKIRVLAVSLSHLGYLARILRRRLGPDRAAVAARTCDPGG